MWNLTDIKDWIIDTKDTIMWKWHDMSRANKIMAIGLTVIAIWIITKFV
jgi:hypothetical protein